jgi:hypothetical protein
VARTTSLARPRKSARRRRSKRRVKALAQQALEKFRIDRLEIRASIRVKVLDRAHRQLNLDFVDAFFTRMRRDVLDERDAKLHEIALARPISNFRKWLKARAFEGEAAAAQAIKNLREGTADMIAPTAEHHPHTGGDTIAYAQAAARAAVLWSDPDPATTAPREEHLERLEKFTIAATALATPDQLEAVQALEETILNLVPEPTRHGPEAAIISRAAATVPLAIDLAMKGDLDYRVARELYSPLDTVGEFFENLSPSARVVNRRADYLHVEAKKHGLGAFAPMPADFVPVYARDIEPMDPILAEQYAHEDGHIGAGTPKSQDLDDLDRRFRPAYDAYINAYAELGYGERGQRLQRDIADHRTNVAETALAVERAKIKSTHWMQLSHLDAQALKLRLDIERRATLEHAVLEALTGAKPPPSYADFLRSLNDPDATRLAKTLPPEPDLEIPVIARFNRAALLDLTAVDTPTHVAYHIGPRHLNRVAFRDDGELIHLKNAHHTDAVDAAILFASEKFGGTIDLQGSRSFQRIALARAVELGVTVTNPELQAEQDRLIEARDARRAEAAAKHHPDTKLSKAFRAIAAEPADAPNRRERLDDLTLQAVRDHLANADPHERPVYPAVAGQSGTLVELLTFQRHAYALIATSDLGELRLATLHAGEARNLEAQLGQTVTIGRDPINDHLLTATPERKPEPEKTRNRQGERIRSGAARR